MGFFSQVILTIFPVFRPIYKSYFNPVSLLLFCFGHFFLLTVSRKIWWRPVERVRLSKSAVNRMTVERYWRTLKPTLPIFSQLKMFWSLAFCASQAALVECAHQILRQGLCWQEWPRGRAQVMLTVAKSGADLENQKITNLWSQKFPNKNRWAFFRGRSCNRNPQSGHNLTSNDGRTTDDLPLPTWIWVLLIRFISNLQMWLKAWKRWDPKWLCERKIYSGIILAFVQTTFFLKEGEPGLAKNGDPLSTSPFPVVVPFVASRLFWGTVPEYAKHTGWCVLNLDIYI